MNPSVTAVLIAIASVSILAAEAPKIATRSASILIVAGQQFRDANRNGKLEPYEDWRLPVAARVRDLLARMTLPEKAGAMMHGTAPGLGSPGGFSNKGYDLDAARALIEGRHVTSMISRLALQPTALAGQNNALQAIAEAGRLGIPLTLSTDPRHHFQYVQGASVASSGFSQWPETLGFAALNDPVLMRMFGNIARQEYRATGFHMALSPQADLATEPRWPRVTGTFGEDPALVSKMAQGYIEGFQNGAQGLGPSSVAAIVKHWVGYGAAKDGWDSHSYYGRYAQIDEKAFAAHVRAFEGAFAAKTAGVMPTYSILENLTVQGKPVEQVGGGFNRWLLTDLLRGKYGFQGMIVSDWAITNDCGDICRNGYPAGKPPGFQGISMAWGVEQLTPAERFAKGVNAGIDQFGGTEDASSLLAAVQAGLVTEKRIDESVTRVLRSKFQLGLFENPYADEGAVINIAGSLAFVKLGRESQAKAMVLLENKNQLLPLARSKRVYLHGFRPEAAQIAGFNVAPTAEQADVVIVRTSTPHQLLHPGFFFGVRQNEGDLDFKDDNADWKAIREISATGKPVVVAIYLDRPAILTNVAASAAAILANFGATDDALFDALAGRVRPQGKLPFELPRSMDAVRRQRSDTPHDSVDPLYPIFSAKNYTR